MERMFSSVKTSPVFMSFTTNKERENSLPFFISSVKSWETSPKVFSTSLTHFTIALNSSGYKEKAASGPSKKLSLCSYQKLLLLLYFILYHF